MLDRCRSASECHASNKAKIIRASGQKLLRGDRDSGGRRRARAMRHVAERRRDHYKIKGDQINSLV
jgi:hypothetical protein